MASLVAVRTAEQQHDVIFQAEASGSALAGQQPGGVDELPPLPEPAGPLPGQRPVHGLSPVCFNAERLNRAT